MDPFTFGRGLLKLSYPPLPSTRTHGVHGTAVRLLEDSSSVDDHRFVWRVFWHLGVEQLVNGNVDFWGVLSRQNDFDSGKPEFLTVA